jgi:TATA-box binding protein (TBP) (component of TFIID and TFIIIB)
MWVSVVMSKSKVQGPILKNIKFHFKIGNLQQLNNSIADLITLKLSNNFKGRSLSIKHNFVVYRHTYVYTIFFNTGFINCTKVTNYPHISEAIKEFCSDFKIVRKSVSKIVVDNTTSSGAFKQIINLYDLKAKINQETETQAHFNPTHFPGLFFRLHSKGTIIVFASGKYTIVGAKWRKDVKLIFQKMKAFLRI